MLHPEVCCPWSLGTGSHRSHCLSHQAPFLDLAGTRDLRNHLVLCFSVGLQVADQDT